MTRAGTQTHCGRAKKVGKPRNRVRIRAATTGPLQFFDTRSAIASQSQRWPEPAGAHSEAALPVDDEPEFGSLELPGSFADYVGADDDVAVCSEVSLDDIIETVRPDTARTSDEEEMDDAAEASMSVPTYADVLCYVDHIRRFACARDEIGDLLPDVAAIERKLMPLQRAERRHLGLDLKLFSLCTFCAISKWRRSSRTAAVAGFLKVVSRPLIGSHAARFSSAPFRFFHAIEMPGDSRLKPSTQRAFGSRKKRAWNKKAPATSAPSAAELESRPDPLDLPGTSTDDTVGPSSTSETLRVDAAYYSTAEQAQRVERSAQTKTVLSGNKRGVPDR
ncbi:hypothetical protein HPB52_015415 [Rhipicephalus sanguineus]|uniref:Uncharacterized protein n=1 Tax=Rhipicephalus sanguineus TaxID=34632 RepID=A0A9D4PNI3_RHISA|nr:hypothetical protein HPB52_015415 [Rhipicephalus sanguineus]